MKAINILMLGFLLIRGLCFSQNLDSLNSVYRQYYETTLLTTSPSGRYAVVNHHNTYGKNDDELLDLKTGQRKILEKHDTYHFLVPDGLLMRNRDHTRFFSLTTGRSRDLPGNYAVTLAESSGAVVLFDARSNKLTVTSPNGTVRWTENGVRTYLLDDRSDRLVYVSGHQLGIRDLRNHRSKTVALEDAAQWIAPNGNRIFCAAIQESRITLYQVDLPSGRLTRETITSPEGFAFAPALLTYFEIREGQHFLMPLYLKRKLTEQQDPELNITYSNKNSRDRFLNHHLGIYNLQEKRWDYRPDVAQNLPVYRFLNDKGDFILYDQSHDAVEEQSNSRLELRFVRDYGKSEHRLPQKRGSDTGYYWDRDTEQLIFFDKKRWVTHDLRTGSEKELPLNTEGWESDLHSGLGDNPETPLIRVKNKPAVLLANQFDYFFVDLRTHTVQRITKGAEHHIKYTLVLSKDQRTRSSWGAGPKEVDLEKELTFKLFNLSTYDSGFAWYSYKKDKTFLYKQQRYKAMVPYDKGVFFTSDFALEPFRLTRVEKGTYTVVYESLPEKKAALAAIRYKLFSYKTRYGRANAALVFPSGYDAHQKYPMVVNIYEKQSRDLCYFLPPYLTAMVGFNYMHYVMNGYFVLLPDLQYKTADTASSIIASLEKSIDSAKELGSIDEKNVGVAGLSFGGYETGLALVYSDYFKTGVAGVMVSDLVSNALSNSELMTMPNYTRVENQQFRMKNSVFDDWNNYLENSPVYHLKNVNSPVLIWSGLQDKNVSPAQSKMFFLGLKRLRKKAVLLEYRNETHNVFKPSNQLDLNVKMWQWFDYYLKNKEPADWMVPITN